MCGQNSRARRAAARQSMADSCCCCRCCCTPVQSCDCGCETTAPTATISMADYEPFILVPTTVFDQGDVGCPCGFDW